MINKFSILIIILIYIKSDIHNDEKMIMMNLIYIYKYYII